MLIALRRLLLMVTVFMLGISSALAGTLDPRLSMLISGRSVIVRSANKTAVSGPSNSFMPRVDSEGRVQVYILPVSQNAPLPDTNEIARLGGVQILVSEPLHLIQAWVPKGALNTLAALPNVGRVTVPTYAEIPHPIVKVRNKLMQNVSGGQAMPRGVATGLVIDGDAVQAMQADLLQSVNANGANIKIGVISDDDSGNADSQAAGYLPATVWADPNYPGSTPTPGDPAEGTAMLEEVHAMASGASLGFCGPSTTAEFLTCYQDFVNWGANVIVDDLGFSPDDMFTTGATADGSFAAAIVQITQANPKAAFVSSAGNDAQDYFEAPYIAGPACTISGIAYPSCMDFGKALGQSSANAISVTMNTTNQFTPVLEWNDPLGSTADQLVLYLVNSSGTVLAAGTAGATNDGRPNETLSYTPATAGEKDYFFVACAKCGDPIYLKIFGNGDGAVLFGTPTAGSIDAGQKVAAGVLATVAAGVNAQSPLSISLEAFSGIGPFLYGDYTGTQTLAKPDLLGIDSVIVSGAGGFSASSPAPGGGVYFCGTSATGPNVGALIADMMQADPGQPASFYYNALENAANQTAIGSTPFSGCNDLGNALIVGYSHANAGSGLAQGFAALKSFFVFPSTSISAPITVADGGSGSYTVPVNVAITFMAGVTAGTNAASANNCQWLAGASLQNAAKQTGASVAYTFPGVGSYTVQANCPDSNGIADPNPPQIAISAQNLPPPTAAISNASSAGFNLTLTGTEPLALRATSTNVAVVPDSGIVFSSGCGSSTLNCSVTLSPAAQANGSATVTVTATDPYARSASADTQVSYTYTPPKSGGGGGMGWGALLLFGFLFVVRQKRGIWS